MAELGIFMALFDEVHGGFGGEGFDFALVFEALGRALVVEPVVESIGLAGEPRTAFAHFEAMAGPDRIGND